MLFMAIYVVQLFAIAHKAKKSFIVLNIYLNGMKSLLQLNFNNETLLFG
jgi:hypothetical protein